MTPSSANRGAGRRFVEAAFACPGVSFPAVFSGSRLAAYMVTCREQKWLHILHQMSRQEDLPNFPNHLLTLHGDRAGRRRCFARSRLLRLCAAVRRRRPARVQAALRLRNDAPLLGDPTASRAQGACWTVRWRAPRCALARRWRRDDQTPGDHRNGPGRSPLFGARINPCRSPACTPFPASRCPIRPRISRPRCGRFCDGAPLPEAFGLLGDSPKFWTRSGRQALRLLLGALDLKPGSGVALPLFTDPSLVQRHRGRRPPAGLHRRGPAVPDHGSAVSRAGAGQVFRGGRRAPVRTTGGHAGDPGSWPEALP